MENYFDYYEILEEIKRKGLYISKIYIFSELDWYHDFKILENEEKMKIIDLIYSYYIQEDLIENNLFNLIEITQDYIDDIKEHDFDFKYFENLMNCNI